MLQAVPFAVPQRGATILPSLGSGVPIGTTAEVTPEIMTQVRSITSLVEALSSRICELQAKIQPICRPMSPGNNAPCDKERPIQTPLGDLLYQRASELQSLVSLVSEMISTVEV